MNVDAIMTTATELLMSVGLKVLGAIVLWIVGRWLIGVATNLVRTAMRARSIAETIALYTTSALAVLLNVILIVAILGFFGVETTSFAAVLAAAGIAIGMAWSGLLANFAAGAFMVVLRPFAVGDFVSAGDVLGTVEEIGLFATTIKTMDNVKTIVGNNKIFGGNIQNFSALPYRRVDLVAQLNNTVKPADAVALLRTCIGQIPNVLSDPAPDIEILEFNLAGPVLAVRPYCSNDHYWQVYFDTNRAIAEEFGKAGYPAPVTHHYIKQVA